MYVGTKFILRDTSTVAPIVNNSTAVNRPTYLAMFTSDRGPEKFTIMEGTEWAKTYLTNNTPNYVKHGQPLLQAALDVNAGAKIFSKRIVADNAHIGSATFAIGVSTRQYTVITYTKVEAGTTGAKKVVSTTHKIDPDTEVDIATLDPAIFAVGDFVKSVSTYKVVTDGALNVVGDEKTQPSSAAMILENSTTLYGKTKTVSDKAYPVEGAAVIVSTPPTGETGWTQITSDWKDSHHFIVDGAGDGYFIYRDGGDWVGKDGTTTKKYDDEIVGQYWKEATAYIDQSLAADETANVFVTGTLPTDYKTIESKDWPAEGPGAGNVTVSTVKSAFATAIAGLSDTEKNSIAAIKTAIEGLVGGNGEKVSISDIIYKADDPTGAKVVASTTHTVDPDTEIDIAEITGIAVVEGDYVVKTPSIEKSIDLRPMLYSMKNTEDFHTGVKKDKENLYRYACDEIKDIVFTNETYTKTPEEGGIFLSNGTNEGGSTKRYKLFTDASATITDGIVYPLFTVYDVGRGASDKLIVIEPNYSVSKSTGAMEYNLNVIDANTGASLESSRFAVNVNATTAEGKSMDIQTRISGYSNLVDAATYFDAYESLYAKIAEFGIPASILTDYDILNKTQISGKAFGKPTYTGTDGETYVLATPLSTSNPYGYSVEPYDYSYKTASALQNGTNGDLANMNANKSLFYTLMHEALTGVFSLDIYNLDLFTFDCIFDANYDNAQVKLDIQNLAIYRGDVVAFMDMGVEVSSLQECKDMMAWDGTAAGKADLETNPKYAYKKDSGIYVTSVYYDQKNPYDGRQITVTCTLGLSLAMVSHYSTGYNRPFAGQMFNITFPQAIKGTVNYIPKIYPNTTFTPEDIDGTYPSDSNVVTNEKQEMADIKVNYASYYNDILTMDTLYTTYKKDSELSYVNNVLTVQKIIKEIRNILPSTTRYGFMDGDTLVQYKGDIQNRVIDKYSAYFDELKFDYVEDITYVQNKIFYGALTVKFKTFSQSEIIRVTVLNNDSL